MVSRLLFVSLHTCMCMFMIVISETKSIIIIEREGEYPTPVYHSVVSLDRWT